MSHMVALVRGGVFAVLLLQPGSSLAGSQHPVCAEEQPPAGRFPSMRDPPTVHRPQPPVFRPSPDMPRLLRRPLACPAPEKPQPFP